MRIPLWCEKKVCISARTETCPGSKAGGHAVDGTPDTRGIMEKTADALTGDNIDDKTGKRVD